MPKKKKSLQELRAEQKKADAVRKARAEAAGKAKAKPKKEKESKSLKKLREEQRKAKAVREARAKAKAKPKAEPKEELSPFNKAIRKLKKKVQKYFDKEKEKKKPEHELDARMRKELKEAGYNDKDVESLMRKKKK